MGGVNPPRGFESHPLRSGAGLAAPAVIGRLAVQSTIWDSTDSLDLPAKRPFDPRRATSRSRGEALGGNPLKTEHGREGERGGRVAMSIADDHSSMKSAGKDNPERWRRCIGLDRTERRRVFWASGMRRAEDATAPRRCRSVERSRTARTALEQRYPCASRYMLTRKIAGNGHKASAITTKHDEHPFARYWRRASAEHAGSDSNAAWARRSWMMLGAASRTTASMELRERFWWTIELPLRLSSLDGHGQKGDRVRAAERGGVLPLAETSRWRPLRRQQLGAERVAIVDLGRPLAATRYRRTVVTRAISRGILDLVQQLRTADQSTAGWPGPGERGRRSGATVQRDPHAGGRDVGDVRICMQAQFWSSVAVPCAERFAKSCLHNPARPRTLRAPTR